ncbi:dihydrolipoamide acetyltransferase family protein [Thermogemmatispora carboxidivorans]|uniref:dihydrolipoamide acetyltransferase family protein n=1 Tax=Thermogemmatispora carboxidivorans TaxID=1382306 RepID=UPI00069B6163|nr:dihydrolipoamide acetyltransferase family protein [Thermogemmatispora carboxidivorans]
MPTPVKFPRLGESVAEGTVAAWLKHEGDYVEKDEALAEVVTDKVNAELPSPVAGRLVKILVPADQTVPVGTAIALIEEEGARAEVAEEARAGQSESGSVAAAQPAPVGEQVTSAAAVQRGTSALSVAAEAVTAEPHDGQQPGERQRISPLARRLAREHGLDLNEIKGTGVGGRVRKEDILAYLEQRQLGAQTVQTPAAAVTAQPKPAPTTVVSTAAGAARGPEPVAVGPDEEVIVPDRMRLAIAEHMVRSKRTAPHATTVVEVDMTAIARWLERNKEEFKRREGYSISYVPFVMKAVCEGIRKVPLINSSWTEENRIVVKKRIHLGVAVATDSGLVVPTIHDADQYTIAGLARRLNEVAQRARSNRLTVQDLQGSTFVVNNPGTFGTILSVPIINQPHAAILSMDAVVKRPVVTEDDAIAIRSMMYLCLSFDHRILDGAGAATFLQAVRAKLQSYGPEIDVY